MGLEAWAASPAVVRIGDAACLCWVVPAKQQYREERMRKSLAIAVIIGWSAFWAFGYLALTAPVDEATQIIVASILAFAGLITGSAAYFRICKDGC